METHKDVVETHREVMETQGCEGDTQRCEGDTRDVMEMHMQQDPWEGDIKVFSYD